MENADRKAIRTNLVRTCPDLDLSKISMHLIQAGIYESNGKLDVLMEIRPTNVQNMKFLNDIQRRGPTAFKILIKSLRNTNQGYIADFMDPEKRYKADSIQVSQDHPDNSEQLIIAHPISEQSHGPPSDQVDNQPQSVPRIIGQPSDQVNNQPQSVPRIVGPPSDQVDNQPQSVPRIVGQPSDQVDNQPQSVPRVVGPSSDHVYNQPQFGPRIGMTSGPSHFLRPDEYYKMTAEPRGIALIINNETFNVKKLGQRTGTDKDSDSMEELFGEFGFLIIKKKNLKAKQMIEIFQNNSDTDHGQYDCFVCVIFSHGEEMGIYGTDGESVEIESLVEIMDKCNSLKDKPKLFFTQACRGAAVSRVKLDARQASVDDSGVNNITESTRTLTVSNVGSRSHVHKDVVIGFPCGKGFAAITTEEYGSWYIQSLYKIFRENAKRLHLVEMLTKIHAEIQNMSGLLEPGKHVTQTSEYKSTLVKSLYFYDPRHL